MANSGKKEKRVKYDPSVHDKRAESLAEQGLIDVEIARGLGIARSTYYKWMNKFPDLADAVRRGKEQPDAEVARGLFKNCIGYEYEETKVVAVLDANGKPVGKQIVTRTKKHRPGLVSAQTRWLRLRQPKEWDPAQAISDLGINRVPALDKLPEHSLREIAEGRSYLHDGKVIPVEDFKVLDSEEEGED